MDSEESVLISAIKKVLGATDIEAKTIESNLKDDLAWIRLRGPLILLDYCEQTLPKEDKIIRTLFYLIVLESIVAAKKSNKNKVVADVLKAKLNIDEKMKLLTSFTFTDPYKFRKSKLNLRHLMFKDLANDTSFVKERGLSKINYYCSTSHPYLCHCEDWLKVNIKKIDVYLPEFVNRIYEMRAAMLHEGFGLLWLPDYEHDPNIAMYSSSLVDAHPTLSETDVFRSYESGIDPKEFYGIIINCIRRFLLKIND